MKLLHTFLAGILLLTVGCASSDFDKNPPFTIKQATSQESHGGVRDAPIQTQVWLTIASDNSISKTITWDSIFFKHFGGKIEKKNDTVLMGHFYKNTPVYDIEMNENPIKESKNTPPNQRFTLEDHSAVISYYVNNKKRFYKVKNIIKKAPIQYPSAPKEDTPIIKN